MCKLQVSGMKNSVLAPATINLVYRGAEVQRKEIPF